MNVGVDDDEVLELLWLFREDDTKLVKSESREKPDITAFLHVRHACKNHHYHHRDMS